MARKLSRIASQQIRSGKDESRLLRLRHSIALPRCTVSLILDFASAALGRLAAWIAGDDWQE